MTVVLEPPLTRGIPQRRSDCPPDQPLATAPRFMRSTYQRYGNPGRWHRPRSGTRVGLTGHVVYHAWCGQSLFAERLMTADKISEGEEVCGTCTGRAIGAGQDQWPVPGGPELLFEPRRLQPPARCPGSRSPVLFLEEGRNVLRCLACGDLVKGHYRSYNYGPVNHSPGRGLVPGCPFHAWDHLMTAGDGTVTCSCKIPKAPGTW